MQWLNDFISQIGTRLGRQSNSIKRSTLMTYQMQEFEGSPAKMPACDQIKSEPLYEGYPSATGDGSTRSGDDGRDILYK